MDPNGFFDAAGAAARAAWRGGWAEFARALYPSLCWLCRARATVDGLGCELHGLSAQGLDPAEPRCAGCAGRLPAGMTLGPCAHCRREARGYRRLVVFGPWRRDGALREWVLA